MKKSFTRDFLEKYIFSKNTSNIRNNDYFDQDKTNKKFTILTKKVLSKHEPLTNEKRKQLREKRLNTIFNRNDYYYINSDEIKYNEKKKKKNYSLIVNEKSNNNFLEKYRDLYNLTKNNLYFNNNNNNNNLSTKNKISYYINILKYNNEKDYKINNLLPSNLKNISKRKMQIKRKYNSIKDDLIENQNINYNLDNPNIKTIINKNKILNLLINIDNLNKNRLTNSFNIRPKNTKINSNLSDGINGNNSLRFYSPRNNTFRKQYCKINYYENKVNKGKSMSNNYLKRYNNNINKNIFIDDFNYFSERINDKVNSFKTRINLLSLK